MRAVLLALFALLILASNAIRIQSHKVYNDEQAQEALAKFMEEDSHILGLIIQKKVVSDDEQAMRKILQFITTDQKYQEYLLSTLPPIPDDHPDKATLENLMANDKQAYLIMLLEMAQYEVLEQKKAQINEAEA